MKNSIDNKNKPNLTGMIIIDKPLGDSSMQMIRIIRKLTGIRKVGHAGTLDPLATGVLLVCIGREFTKKINQLMETKKEYVAKIDLSAFSETDDSEGKLTHIEIKKYPSQQQIEEVLQTFIGKQKQMPPKYSAIKIGAQPAYKMARKNIDFKLGKRDIEIHEIKLLDYKAPILNIGVTCGKGTYIRSLARDIGEKLGTGGYLSSLKRTAVGEYRIESAHTLENISTITPEMLIKI